MKSCYKWSFNLNRTLVMVLVMTHSLMIVRLFWFILGIIQCWKELQSCHWRRRIVGHLLLRSRWVLSLKSKKATFLNGALHWHQNSNYIIAFDLTKDSFFHIPIEKWLNNMVILFQGCLCYILASCWWVTLSSNMGETNLGINYS